MTRPDAVLKIGGSLERTAGLSRLCREIGRLGADYSLLVVPGGGRFADSVRKAYRKYGLGETAAHRMALLAMDQYGYLLNSLVEDSVLEAGLDAACRAARSGRAAILLPSSPVLRDDDLPHSWDVTSDSIAAWVAGRTGCARLILLKDVDGLMPCGIYSGGKFSGGKSSAAWIESMTVSQLADHSGCVDAFLSRILSLNRMETWVINGLKPERVAELLYSGATTGTCIRPD
jgi:aspartokinase-like uncharacterized kinase